MQGTQYAPRESILCMEHFVALHSMHIDHCCVDLGELYMILTVHGSDHKKSKCIKYHK